MTDTESLTRSAAASSDFFDGMLDLIPAAYYFSLKGKVANQKYWQNVKDLAPKMDLKLKTKKALKSALIGDDLSKKSVKELIASGFDEESSDDGSETETNDREDSDEEEDLQEEEEDGEVSEDGVAGSEDESEEEDEGSEGSSDEDDSDDSDDDEDVPTARSKGERVSFVPKGKIGGVNMNERSSELRQKLLDKINDWRKTRKAAPIDEEGHELTDQAPHSKRKASREAKAAKSGKPELSRREQKNLKKRKRKEEALKSMARSQPRDASTTTTTTTSQGGADSDEEMPIKKKAKVVEDISFGKVQFEDGHAKSHFEKRADKKLTKEQQLAKLQREKAYAQKLQGTEEGEKLSESKAWDKTFKRLEGEKVKDRADLLRKAIKREESAKRKSKREWDERKASVKTSQDDRQKKRAANIKERMDSMKLKRMGKKGSSKSNKKK